MAVDATTLLGTRYLQPEDYADPWVQILSREIAALYREEMGGVPHRMWARRPDEVLIQWSRDWEYPWAILNYLAWRRANRIMHRVRLVDLGCGGSPLPIYLAEQPGTALMLGLDWNDVLVPTAETSTLRRYGRPVTFPERFAFCRADILKPLPLQSGSVDGVFSVSVLEDYPDAWVAIFAEIERVLRPGGFALITVDVGRSGTKVDAVGATLLRLLTMERPGDLWFLRDPNVSVTPTSLARLPGAYHVLGLSLVKRARALGEDA